MSKQPTKNGLLIEALFQSRGVLATLVVSQTIAVLLAFSPASYGDVWLRLAVFSFFLHLVFLTSVAVLYLSRGQLVRLSNTWQVIVLSSLLLLLTSLYSFLVLSLFDGLYQVDSLAHFLASNMLIIFLVTVLFVQFISIHNQKEQQTKALIQAELDALQARIRPHFLFNSLNTAAELTHHDANAAEQAILALAALSQAAMRSGKAISLSDEISLCQQYISLEKWRYGERLVVCWQLPDEIPALGIPCLTIQPLIENAVCYGVEPADKGARINISMHVSEKSYTFIITNPLYKNKGALPSGNGMALENIRQRLGLFYNYKAQLLTTQREGEFRVKLVLPRLKIQ